MLHVTSESFGGTPGLTQLRLYDHSQLQLAPRCLSNLSHLAELTLRDCGLSAVPAALAGVQHSLRLLDLSFNDKLQISQAGFDTLLALRVLESVTLKQSRADNWTNGSVSFLARFLAEWQDLRPGASRPAISI